VPSRTFSEINGDFCQKSQIPPIYPVCLTPRWGSSPWNVVTAVAQKKKTRFLFYRWKEFDYMAYIKYMYICLDTECHREIETDGRTDGQRERFAIKVSRSVWIGVLTRDKNQNYMKITLLIELTAHSVEILCDPSHINFHSKSSNISPAPNISIDWEFVTSVFKILKNSQILRNF